jgi:hypothetical protein
LSSDEPSGEQPRIRRDPSGPIPTPPADDTRTSIIRRHPFGAGDEPLARRAKDTDEPLARRAKDTAEPLAHTDEPLSDDTRTSMFGPAPTELQPAELEETATGIIPPARPVRIPGTQPPNNSTAVAASAVSIISGWATAVVATGLITGWWRTDRLFCVGVGFLTAVFGACAIAGVVGLLLRRRVGIYLTVVSALLALLIFAGIFIAGAHMAGVVYAFPALPLATILLASVRPTWRWTA